jgi:hypothetical protein
MANFVRGDHVMKGVQKITVWLITFVTTKMFLR